MDIYLQRWPYFGTIWDFWCIIWGGAQILLNQMTYQVEIMQTMVIIMRKMEALIKNIKTVQIINKINGNNHIVHGKSAKNRKYSPSNENNHQ